MSDRFTSHSRFGEIYNGKRWLSRLAWTRRGERGYPHRISGTLRSPPTLCPVPPFPPSFLPPFNSTRSRELKGARSVASKLSIGDLGEVETGRTVLKVKAVLVSLLRHVERDSSLLHIYIYIRATRTKWSRSEEAKIAVRSGSYLGRYTGGSIEGYAHAGGMYTWRA